MRRLALLLVGATIGAVALLAAVFRLMSDTTTLNDERDARSEYGRLYPDASDWVHG